MSSLLLALALSAWAGPVKPGVGPSLLPEPLAAPPVLPSAPAAAAATPQTSAAVDQARAAAQSGERPPRAALDGQFDGAIERPVDQDLDFPQVELVRRNHAIGLYEGQPLRLRPWNPVSARVAIGVDARGRLFHVLDLGDRTVGYLLSGDKEIRAAFLTRRGALVAVDREGRLYQYSEALWGRSGLRRILAGSLARFVAAAGAVAVALTAYHWLAYGFLWPPSPETLAAFAMGAVGLAMIEGFRAGVRYEAQNALTDGLRPLGASVPGYRRFESDGTDAALIGSEGGRSLRGLLEKSAFRPADASNFDVQEKHFRLPRGIDPKAWEPEIR